MFNVLIPASGSSIFFDALNFSISPKSFEVVKIPFFLLKNMANYIQIIQQYPFSVLLPFFVPGRLPRFFENFFFNGVADRIYLSIRSSCTNYKIVGYGIFYLPKVKYGNVLRFFFQHSLHCKLCKPGGGEGVCRQMNRKCISFGNWYNITE